MPRQVYISIDTPCHEDWNAMTPTAQGAFCSNCNKQVIDFTRKTENEIYDIVTQNDVNLCGRFTQFQLEQPVRKTEIKNGLMNWRAIAASLATLASVADVKEAKAQHHTQIVASTCPEKISGDTADRRIRAVVIEEENKEPVASANIMLKNARLYAVTDNLGRFCFDVNMADYKTDSLQIKYIGCETITFPVASLTPYKVALFELKQQIRYIDVVVVTGGLGYSSAPIKKCKKKKR